jgi:hypothetical protein
MEILGKMLYLLQQLYVLGPLLPFLEGFVAFFGGIRT